MPVYPGRAKPEAFQPGADKKINNVVKKFYDSLHYMHLMGKDEAERVCLCVGISKWGFGIKANDKKSIKKETAVSLAGFGF